MERRLGAVGDDEDYGGICLGLGLGEWISVLKTVNTLLSESTEGRTRHKGGRAFARTCIHHEVRSAEVPKVFFTCTQQVSRSMSM